MINSTQGTEGKAVVATLTVQRVTDFERATATSLRRDYDPSYESIMRCGIKAGNLVAQAEFRYERNYQANGDQRVVKVYNVDVLTDATDKIGIQLDWTAINAEYEALAVAWQADINAEYEALAVAWQAERKALLAVKRAEAWDRSWAQGFILAATPHTAKDGILPGATFTIVPTREKWVADERNYYNGINVEVTYLSAAATRVWSEGAELRMYDAGYKTYRARKVETILKRIRENTDHIIRQTEQRNTTAERIHTNLTKLQQRFSSFIIDKGSNDHSYVIRLLGRERYCHDVVFGYVETNEHHQEFYKLANIDGTLDEPEFLTIISTLKAAAERNDKAEREAAARRDAERS